MIFFLRKTQDIEAEWEDQQKLGSNGTGATEYSCV